jgi:hypothetical protein
MRPIRSGFPRFFALLDQFPEFACFAELRIFGHWQFAPEKEIAKRVLVQNAMNPDAFVSLGEINAVIFRNRAAQGPQVRFGTPRAAQAAISLGAPKSRPRLIR